MPDYANAKCSRGAEPGNSALVRAIVAICMSANAKLEESDSLNLKDDMPEDPYADRRNVSFSQAEGASELPRQLKPKEVSRELRTRLWTIIYFSIKPCCRFTRDLYSRHVVQGPWIAILRQKHVQFDNRFIDDFENDADQACSDLKEIFEHGDYLAIFNFLQWLLQRANPPIKWEEVNFVLKDCRAAYRVVDGDLIVPVASSEDSDTISRAFMDLEKGKFDGARVHLRNSSQLITQGKFSDSIRESIHSCEAVARSIISTSRPTLAEALKEINKTHVLHPALQQGFMKLYGFTSDEHGIRHSLLDDANAKVDETDALFMLGACAAFVSYLLARRGQQPSSVKP